MFVTHSSLCHFTNTPAAGGRQRIWVLLHDMLSLLLAARTKVKMQQDTQIYLL